MTSDTLKSNNTNRCRARIFLVLKRFIAVKEFKTSKSLAMPFGGTTPFRGSSHSSAHVTPKDSSNAIKDPPSGLPCCLYLLEYTASAHSCRKLKAGELVWWRVWASACGTKGPCITGGNAGKAFALVEGKTTPVNPAGASGFTFASREVCADSFLCVCLLNPLSGLLWARFGFHC